MNTGRCDVAEEPVDLLNDRSHEAREIVYPDTAAEGLLLDNPEHGLTCCFRDKSLGTPGPRFLYAHKQETIGAAARRVIRRLREHGAGRGRQSRSNHSGLLDPVVARRRGADQRPRVSFQRSAWLRLLELGVIPSESGVIPYERLASQIHRAQNVSHGRVCASVHLHNDSNDIARFLAQLHPILGPTGECT